VFAIEKSYLNGLLERPVRLYQETNGCSVTAHNVPYCMSRGECKRIVCHKLKEKCCFTDILRELVKNSQ